MKKTIKISIFLLVFSVNAIFVPRLLAYVMSSGNYRIESDDSLTPAGGISNSVNYIFRDSMGQVSSGASNSALYKIKAGYQEMQEVYLNVSAPADVALNPPIAGISGGTASARTDWTVTTDSSSGFDVKINASTNPAMKLSTDSSDVSIADYSSTPTYNWNVGSNLANFGFNVIPATVGDALSFQDNGTSCGSGTGTGKCWSGLTQTPTTIIHRASQTGQDGEDEQVIFQAQSNGKFLRQGDYVALITVTVSSN